MSEIEHDFGDGIAPEPTKAKLNSIVIWFLLLLPMGIILGTSVGMYRYYNKEEELAHTASKQISSTEMSQILQNYTQFFGDRHYNSKEGVAALRAVTANLMGELQPNNSMLVAGSDEGSYEAAGEVWKTYWADIKGSTNIRDVFFVVTSYDGKNELRNAAKIALSITVAKSLAAQGLDYTLRFVFVPIERDLIEQKEWVEQHCMKNGETNVGMFFLAHGKTPEVDVVRQDSWKVTDGDTLWADELLKGTRVMHYGIASLHHGVLNANVPYTGSESDRVVQAARGLREILFLVMGGDR